MHTLKLQSNCEDGKMLDLLSIDDRLDRLTELGDILVKMNKYVDWTIFKPILNEICYTEDNRAGGRKPYDRIMMFKILILQSLYNISDDAVEYQINDRLSFQRFLGIEIGDKVADAKTIWLFRDKLVRSGRYKEIFDLYTNTLELAGLITRSGSIVDATFVERPHQHKPKNNGDDKSNPKNGSDNESNPNRERQVDKDARGAKKYQKSFYGYKNHVKADSDSKLITDYSVTSADRHDGAEAPNILSEKDKNVYMDSCYRGKELEKQIQAAAPNADIFIIRKHDGYHAPTMEQLEANIPVQKIRQRVEHIFGYMVKAMGGKFIRCCGISRANLAVTIKNLTYNMCRASFLFAKSMG